MHPPQHDLQTDWKPAFPPAPAPSLFPSFWLGGFESACHITRNQVRRDMIEITQHDRFALEDYQRLREIGMRAARDAVRWHLVDRRGRYDFRQLDPLVDAALATQTQVIWTLCHYGWPEGINLLGPDFIQRFADYAYATATYLRRRQPATVAFYCPINEISFLTYAAGHIGCMYPFYRRRGHLVKPQLVRATIAAIDAIRAADPRARFVHSEPIINIVPSPRKPEAAHKAIAKCEGQFEAWDMLCGRACPELGGHDRYIDIAGLNFYHNNQWQHPGGVRIHWHKHPRDPRWVPLHRLLAYFYRRYHRPMMLTETSHIGTGRAEWIREVASEVRLARQLGVPMEGICVFPVLDRPDWDDLDHWHNSGLWDLHRQPDGTLERVLNREYYRGLHEVQRESGEAPDGVLDSAASAEAPKIPSATA